jgi:hypothetical protein
VRYDRKLPGSGRKLLGLGPEFALADFSALDKLTPFAEMRLAWNEKGLGIAVEIGGKKRPPECPRQTPEAGDGLRVFLDTRNTQNIHRASRYCQQFFLFPSGGGSRGTDPWAVQVPILRAREEAPCANVAEIELSASISKTGYVLEAWLPASVLYGYDPEAQLRLGFYYALHDSEQGDQYLAVGPEFPFAVDPSLWSTLELTKK